MVFFRLPILNRARGEELVARVEQHYAFGQRNYEVRAGIKGSRKRAAGLANAHAAHSTGYDDDAQSQENRSPSEQGQRNGCAPMNFGIGRDGSRAGGERLTIFQPEIKIAGENSDRTCDHSYSTTEQ